MAAESFTDMTDHWAKSYVDDVVAKGLFNGISDTAFDPEGSMTRGMFVTVLSRIAGVEVDDSKATAFADVATNTWYSGAVAWAVEKGITNGIDEVTFGVNDPVTREQMATFIVRYCAAMNITLPETVEAQEFTDADKIGDYAKEAVATCQLAGIFNGSETGAFNPQSSATRAECAAVFSRFSELKEVNFVPTYTVTFDSNGGSDVDDQKVKEMELVKEPEAPTKDGYKFVGWYTDEELTKSFSFGTTKVDSSFTLYAKWDLVSAGGGTTVSGPGSSSGGIAAANRITGFAQPVYTKDVENKEIINKMMTALWTDTDNEQDVTDFGFAVDKVFSFDGNTLTVDASKVTDELKNWITEKLPGTSVPVALRFNTIKVNGVETSEDWSNACLIWVDLGNLPEFNTSELKSLGTTDFTYTVKVTVASDTVQASAASTAADQTILDKFKEGINPDDKDLLAVIDQLVDKEDPAQLSEIVNGKTTATGSLPYVENFSWYGAGAEGNFFMFTIEAKTAEERAAFLALDNDTVVVKNKRGEITKESTKAKFDSLKEDSVYMIMVTKISDNPEENIVEYTVDWDGDGGTKFAPYTFTMDLTQLTLKPKYDSTATAGSVNAESNEIISALKAAVGVEQESVVDSLIDAENPAVITEESGTLKATGNLPYVTGFEWFNTAVEEEQEGNYLVFTIEAKTAKERAAFMAAEDSAVIVSYGDKKITKASFDDKTDDSVYLIMIARITADGSDTLTYTVDWDGDGVKFAPCELIINIADLTLSAADADGIE